MGVSYSLFNGFSLQSNLSPKLRVLHLSDIHVDWSYAENSEAACEYEQVINDFALCCRNSENRQARGLLQETMRKSYIYIRIISLLWTLLIFLNMWYILMEEASDTFRITAWNEGFKTAVLIRILSAVRVPAGPWGMPNRCDIPYRTFESAMRHISRTEQVTFSFLWLLSRIQ